MSQERARGSARERRRERGFTILQMMVVVATIIIISVIAVTNFASVKQRILLNNSAQQVTRYLEKARTDSIKRHAASTSQSYVQVVNSTSYNVAMDFNGDGALSANEVRTVTLPTNVTFNVSPSAPPAISYDWRGRLGSNNRITLLNATGAQVNIDLSGGGDITTNSATLTLPTITSTPYPTPGGSGSPVSTPTPSPSPSPPPPSGAPECYVDTDVTSITIRKSGLTTGYITVTQDQYGKAGSISVSYDSSQLSVSPSTATLDSLGSVQLTIRDVKGGGKDYTTTFTIDHPCGQQVINVTVTQ